MSRRSRTLLKWLSTVAVLALVAAWAVSGWWMIGWQRRDGWFVALTDGRACVGYQDPAGPYTTFGLYTAQKKWWSCELWFQSQHNGTYRDWLAPLWVAAGPLAAMAAVGWRSDFLERKRRRMERCLACGYDRRGLLGDVACPECGTVPTHTPTK